MTVPDGPTLSSETPRARRLPPAPARSSLRALVRDPLGFFVTLTSEYGDIVCYRPAPDTAYLINHPDYVRHALRFSPRRYLFCARDATS